MNKPLSKNLQNKTKSGVSAAEVEQKNSFRENGL